MAVGALTSSLTRASYSNYGINQVDVAAPGSSILSTLMGGGYGYMSGTSMATPHVAGAAALLKSYNRTMGPLDIKAALMKTCVATADAQWTGCNGYISLPPALRYAQSPY